jgi:hypothetical protein
MPTTTTILSMLHESPHANSATRRFRDEPVLTWTLKRLSPVIAPENMTVLCWEDQSAAVAEAIHSLSRLSPSPGTPGEGRGEGLRVAKPTNPNPHPNPLPEYQERGQIVIAGPRRRIPSLDAISASRRWADGWRGGLLNACSFDRGFYGPSIADIRKRSGTDGVILVDPSSALIDPHLIAALIEQWDARPDLDLCFSPAAPGLTGLLVSGALLDKLAQGNSHPGIMLGYRPDSPRRDPLADPACVNVPVRLSRTTQSFTFDSQRQIARLTHATFHLNGELITTGALGILDLLETTDEFAALPGEIVIELNTHRATDPIYSPGRRCGINRAPMSLAEAKELFQQMAQLDGGRLLFAGVGDPLLHDDVIEIIHAAHDAGIAAISLETDFAGISPERIAALASSPVDIVSVHLPASRPAMYQTVMGIDGLTDAINNIRTFFEARRAAGRGTPLLVPTFTKCRDNLPEMEGWYDQWINALGSAVITGPSDYSGLIPEVSPAEISPPKRRPCASLNRRMMVLSDGQIVSCEQDVLGRQPLGITLTDAWQRAADLRRDHANQQWACHSVCSSCKQWHRP